MSLSECVVLVWLLGAGSFLQLTSAVEFPCRRKFAISDVHTDFWPAEPISRAPRGATSTDTPRLVFRQRAFDPFHIQQDWALVTFAVNRSGSPSVISNSAARQELFESLSDYGVDGRVHLTLSARQGLAFPLWCAWSSTQPYIDTLLANPSD